MAGVEIPVKEDGRLNFPKLESDLGMILCNDPKNNYVELIGGDKSLAKEARDNLQSSFDYQIIKVGKMGDNYLIKVGASV